jgi:anthranilate phosphoribosyltransferase
VIREAIPRLIEGQDLTEPEAEGVMAQIMGGETTPAQIAAFLTALRIKGETVDEITGCARAMRRYATPVRPRTENLVDTCGTGGDGARTFNISTTAAFVAAGAGLVVAKHGNHSVSSQCGSADLLQALGVNLELTANQVADCIDHVGFGFLFAPLLHPAMKYAIGPRREIGVRTVFNILGPLNNPASAEYQLIGVYDPDLTEPMAEVLRSLGGQGAMVVHGGHGLDELSTTGTNRLTRFDQDDLETTHVDSVELGLSRASVEKLKGGDANENAEITRSVLRGQGGPRRDVVLLNAAAVLMVGGKARDLPDGLDLAAEVIDSGAANEVLERLIEFSKDTSTGADSGVPGSE